MLRYVARSALSTTKWAGKKSLWAGAVAFVLWSVVEMYDGAHDRLQTRYTQAKDVVVPPAESTYAWCEALGTKLWTSIEHNPGPTLITLGLFGLTIVIHTRNGKSLKEALTSTLTHTTSEPKKPNILVKAENELLLEKLVSTEKVLEAQIENLPDQIAEAERVYAALDMDANRAEEIARNKRRRANEAQANTERLAGLLETAKRDIVELREQLVGT